MQRFRAATAKQPIENKEQVRRYNFNEIAN
jgi:hypothetical protein